MLVMTIIGLNKGRKHMHRFLLIGILLILFVSAFGLAGSLTVKAQEQSSDATLSALTLEDADGNSISLDPDFSSATTEYTAGVANGVDTLTVLATTTDDGATVEYLDSGDTPVDDADDTANGQQVTIWVGDNTIKVRVTAEDDNTVQTYSLVVKREPPVTTLVKNIHLVSDGALPAGFYTNGQIGQRFTTGSHAEGYRLDSVWVRLQNVRYSGSETLTLRIHKFDDSQTNDLGTLVATLNTPSTLKSNSRNRFTAPADIDLEPDTDYILNVHSTGNSRRDLEIESLNSDEETGAPGWKIENIFRYAGEQSTGFAHSLMIEVRGYAHPATIETTDATLSGIGIADDSGNSISVTPDFGSETTSYTASASSTVREVSITAVTSDDGATVEYLDADDEPMVDFDSMAAGLQMPLSLGENTVRVKVTAQDRTTTQTYNIVVRGLPPEAITLVKNTHLSHRNQAISIGTATNGNIGQRFTTGSYADGYGLDSVKVRMNDLDFEEGETLTVRVHEFNGRKTNGLGTEAAVLNTPATLGTRGVITFTAPADVVLKPSTKYIVNFHSTGDSAFDAFASAVAGNGQTGEDGWTIEDTHRRNGSTVLNSVSFMIEVKGYTIPDTEIPSLSSAAVNQSSLELTYDEDLDTDSIPSTSAYSVSVNDGAGVSPSVVSVSGKKVTLTLASPVIIGDTVSLTYAGNGDNRVKDSEGNIASPLADQPVTNNSPDVAAPTLSSAAVDHASLVLTYNEDLDSGSVPSRSAYSVSVNGDAGAEPSRVSISGTTVTLTLTDTVAAGDTVTVSYTVPTSDPVRDVAENSASSLTDQTVTNNTVTGTDATLSNVGLSKTNGFGIPLEPTFDPATTEYTAKARNATDKATILPTTTDTYATVEYLDGDSNTIADAGSELAGHQVSLSVGDNTVKVRVTAEDGQTTTTYTVVVTRAEAPATMVSNVGREKAGSVIVQLDHSQPFTTGSKSTGYTLDSVALDLFGTTANLDVTIRENSRGRPSDTVLYELDDPVNLASGLKEFGAPGNATLDPDTTYWITMLTDTGSLPGWNRAWIRDGLDAGAATGWAIDDKYRRYENGAWSNEPNSGSTALRIQVKGLVLSNDTASTTAEAATSSVLSISGATSTDYEENGTSAVVTFAVSGAATSTTITWSLTGDDSDDLSITSSGELSFNSSPDYETPADSDTDNVYEVTVNASDGTNTATLDVEVTVTDQAETPIGGL